jgi:hypothetical protein
MDREMKVFLIQVAKVSVYLVSVSTTIIFIFNKEWLYTLFVFCATFFILRELKKLEWENDY